MLPVCSSAESHKMAVRCAFLIFATLSVVLADSPDCTSPLETGPCRAAFPRYGFNPDTGKCQEFTYGGCGGNKNNYETIGECQTACEPDCTSPLETGPCRAAIPRYGFNPDTGKCEGFIYGGCRGNRNNYNTIDECRKACGGPDCASPLESGPCEAYIPSYGFNTTSGRCEEFIYGGCKGNSNRYETLQECRKNCPCIILRRPDSEEK